MDMVNLILEVQRKSSFILTLGLIYIQVNSVLSVLFSAFQCFSVYFLVTVDFRGALGIRVMKFVAGGVNGVEGERVEGERVEGSRFGGKTCQP